MNFKTHILSHYKTESDAQYRKLSVTYQVYGVELGQAPIVLVNHALTGNSDVLSQEYGWWKEIVGSDKLIDTKHFTVIAFNIPGNGYDDALIEKYWDFSAKDIARIFYTVLEALNIKKLYAIIGGSLGGGIAWEMVSLYPNFAAYVIPIAADWKSSDWVIGHNHVQESILLHSSKPLEDARKMAMLFYRTPNSFTNKFSRTKTKDGNMYNVVSWLNHHANKLVGRFNIASYLMMNHLLASINIVAENQTIEDALRPIKSTIIQISINSDLLFIPDEIIKTKALLDFLNIPNSHYQIKSSDGHDAFLIEHQQITDFLRPIFKK
jgi:homoserine O-acetyltransferase